ncbi:hypothetical protein PAXRUDRAFT_28852 [Paxillus rubicundulus Ve08.2h10]|uniref:Uncharacterized protein n=1 Tax=Paxillus rubicundulus Ve08.2h10 TaxID=930991 RepID=A0A0D0DGU6_9AGAM|nr:hypothetical protein PAXRUDRAFT_28852 [Paxillus rubicundulus Ve08.2h10]
MLLELYKIEEGKEEEGHLNGVHKLLMHQLQLATADKNAHERTAATLTLLKLCKVKVPGELAAGSTCYYHLSSGCGKLREKPEKSRKFWKENSEGRHKHPLGTGSEKYEESSLLFVEDLLTFCFRTWHGHHHTTH